MEIPQLHERDLLIVRADVIHRWRRTWLAATAHPAIVLVVIQLSARCMPWGGARAVGD